MITYRKVLKRGLTLLNAEFLIIQTIKKMERKRVRPLFGRREYLGYDDFGNQRFEQGIWKWGE
ncbi:hypothetical protein EDD59_11431 [Muricomes intestini]|jgi:hypothetical protein|uniref:Uncharacterized protein n=1 Tax=Muricomes intestini TaxID=1796634 RepID=A0A4R3K4Y7_9FIRM|nr:hypothetical protein EDD59_11431 [Muricomes intestini]